MKYFPFLQASIEKLGEIIPCNDSDIVAIEKNIGFALPESYKEFLLLMGRKTGRLFQGTYVIYDNIPYFKEYANKILVRNNSKNILTEKDFVFLYHHGYQFMFFKLGENNDPKIYYYNECGEDEFEIIYSSFSEFINDVYLETIN
ncbi:SMI1/KNR4 family protein [Hymenobacter sp. BT18]|uniref:SMI1/KNR4 family protein n=1 Tax=Hymenobacter sp. BT18 TaxID=2835648 RepID=UPI00143EF2A4|nr:SMI1/KNR4 family protein [Hymenobacter sp. BT18]QIX60619.1 SMI1/KNR4 family protein [Hymenobacter sp. BT18]